MDEWFRVLKFWILGFKIFGSLRSLLELLFLVWNAALENILTIDNLRKRKIWILDWCCMCERNGELVDHLLIHSIFICGLWCLPCLAFNGLCRRRWWSYWLVGKESLDGIGIVLFGWLFLIIWCSAFDGRWIIGMLRIPKEQFQILNPSF